MNNKRTMAWAVAALASISLLGVYGCGGGDETGTEPLGGITQTNITRSTEGTFSDSARVLAARDAAAKGATWLNADTARGYDNDLSVIRATYPTVRNIEARPDYDLRTVVAVVRAGTTVAKSWSTNEIVTGEPALDTLLTEFAPESIEQLGATTESGSAYFTLKFGQSLNMVKLAERLRGSSANIVASDPNYTAGDGDNIVSSIAHQYVFSRGSGDCPAGCINRHTWQFTISDDGKSATLVKESDSSPVAR